MRLHLLVRLTVLAVLGTLGLWLPESRPPLAAGATKTTTELYLPLLLKAQRVEPPLVPVARVGGAAGGVAAVGDTIYLGVGAEFRVLDAADRAHPRTVASLPLQGVITRILLVGSYAYVAAGPYLHVVEISSPAAPRLVGTWQTPDEIHDMAISGTTAYVADYRAGLRILDVAHHGAPREVGVYSTGGRALGVAVSGQYAYVTNYDSATSGQAVQIVNVADPTAPRAVGSLSGVVTGDGDVTPGIAVAGARVYIGFQSRLVVVDVSDVGHPRQLGSLSLSDYPAYIDRLVIVGDLVYALAEGIESGWLAVVDASDPTHLARLSQFALPGYPAQLGVADGYAYVTGDVGATRENGLLILHAPLTGELTPLGVYRRPPSEDPRERATVQGLTVADGRAYVAWTSISASGLDIVDMADPGAVRRLGTLALAQAPLDVAVVGHTAYLLSNTGLHIVNVSNPAAPQEVGALAVAGEPLRVVAAGNYVYIGEHARTSGGQSVGGGIRIINVSDPAHPHEVGMLPLEVDYLALALSGAHLYVVNEGLLTGVDVSDPSHPREEGHFTTAGPCGDDITVANGVAYVACYSTRDGEGGLYLVDVSTPSAPRQLAFVPRQFLDRVAVAGQTVYLQDTHGVTALDVSNPAQPRRLAEYPVSTHTRGMRTANGYLYVGLDDDGVQMLDLSTPRPLTPPGFVPTPGGAGAVAIAGGTAYVADGLSGVWIADVSNPAAPRVVARVPTSAEAFRVLVAGQYAYVAEDDGVRILDVSRPAQPSQVAFYGLDEGAWWLAIVGHTLYVETDWSGADILVLDVSDPTAPQAVGSFSSTGDVNAMQVVGNRLYLLDNSALRILDVSRPASPREVGRLADVGEDDMSIVGNTAYVIGRDTGLTVVDITDPTRPRKLATYPIRGARSVLAEGSAVYVAGRGVWNETCGCVRDGGLQVLDFSNPTAPRLVAFYESGLSVGAIVGGNVYVADGGAGLLILRALTRPGASG